MDMNKVLAHYNITEEIRFMESFLDECYCHPYNMVEYLSDWYEAKSEFLFKLFGDKVTVDCGEINFKKSYWDIEREMYEDNTLCHNRARLSQLLGELTAATLALPRTEDRWWTSYPSTDNERFADTIQECASFYTIFHNGESIKDKYKAKFMTNGEKDEYIHIHKHQKVAKILSHFYRMVEKVFPKKYTTQIAEARKLTSEVLAQVSMYAGRAKTTGRLHLSIHPFDYITMSQNACGWTSCMALCDEYEDVGDYCAGTVAMMNSNNTIIAYLDAETPYFPCERGEFKDWEWNNKKYRNLIVVDPLIISGIKGYPCANENIDDVIINKVKELAQKNLGLKYEDKIHKGIRRHDAENVPISLCTDKMYNDSEHWDARFMCGDMSNLKILDTTATKNSRDSWKLRYDGIVKCLECGRYLDDSPQPRCGSCRGVYICSHCGDEVYDDYVVWASNGECYCEYCYNENFFACPSCGDRVESEYSAAGEVVNTYVSAILESDNYNERLEKYYDTVNEMKQQKEDGVVRFYYNPSVPDKFTHRHTQQLCANCLEDAIEKGYVVWNDFLAEDTKNPLFSYFFFTNKAFEDEEFLEQIEFDNSFYNWTAIGYEDYVEKVSKMKPVEKPFN